MMNDEKIQIRISSELLSYCKNNFENVSLFIREAVREKIDSGLLTDPSLQFVEIRCRSPYTYYAKLDSVVDGDTIILTFDVGFFTAIKERVRLVGIDTPEINTKKGKKAFEFVEKELTGANLIVETKKKEKYGRYLAWVYYSLQYKNFDDIIRHGKLLNDELVKAGLANRYEDN